MDRYITKDGDMLDAICWRHYGRTRGVVEQVLEANYRLEEQPLEFPANLTILLPQIEEPVQTNLIRLWD